MEGDSQKEDETLRDYWTKKKEKKKEREKKKRERRSFSGEAESEAITLISMTFKLYLK